MKKSELLTGLKRLELHTNENLGTDIGFTILLEIVYALVSYIGDKEIIEAVDNIVI